MPLRAQRGSIPLLCVVARTAVQGVPRLVCIPSLPGVHSIPARREIYSQWA